MNLPVVRMMQHWRTAIWGGAVRLRELSRKSKEKKRKKICVGFV
jgi:hypothetical protein